MNALSEALQSHRQQGLYRHLQERTPHHIDFASNDYLGLSASPKIKDKLIMALNAGCPLGATGSRLLAGQTHQHEQVENFIAQLFGVPSALLFSSGFMANLGVLQSLAGLADVGTTSGVVVGTTSGGAGAAFGSSSDTAFFSDELNHASLVDGQRLTKAAKSIFRHNDVQHLTELLAGSAAACKVIVTESVFSMDGDLAPLREILAVAQKFAAWVVVDEAHATGLFGPRGLGCLSLIESDYERLIAVHTGGKALGGQGAFVLSSQEVRELLINRARSFIFSTALAPLSALQIQYALEEVVSHPESGPQLQQTAHAWRQRAQAMGLQITASQSQIVPVILGSNEKALHAASFLQSRGFDVRAIRSPTVARGSERLRLTFNSQHSSAQRDSLLNNLTEALAC